MRTIRPAEHQFFLSRQESASFLQTPAWAQVKPEWRGESIGWFDGDELVGAGLVLHRKVPRLKRYLSYLPEGPVIDWKGNLSDWLDPMVDHLRSQGAFGIRIGPPVVARTWSANTVKDAVANPDLHSLTQVPADWEDPAADRIAAHLRAAGWRKQEAEGGFAAGQPAFTFRVPLAGRTEEDVLAGMNQLWRRNIRKAAKVGVEVRHGDRDDLAEFHRIYVETAERDGFIPRPLSYFETMWDAMRAEDPDRIRVLLAEHEGDVVAATTWVRVGSHVWYSYGASTTAKRDVRGSNAIQWQMMKDALELGAAIYDLRGITDTVAKDDPQIGLLTFKVGTGGEAAEHLGEWDLPLNRTLYAAFNAYMKRRAAKG